MADIVLDVQSNPLTPAAGQAVVYVGATGKRLQVVDDTGYRRTLGLVNCSVAAQLPAAATRTYIAGSNLSFHPGTLQVGTILRWTLNLTKTAAGVASSTFDVAFGTAGTVADTARLSFTKPAGTAVIDEGTINITAVVRSIGAAGICVGQFHMTHNLAATGHATIPCIDANAVSAAFDMTTLTTVGLCITSGAADVVTIELCTAEALNL